jgi:hypothetical protein
MDRLNEALVAEPVVAGQDRRWRAWQAHNAEIDRVMQQRRLSACLYVLAAAALLSSFWVSFGGAP